jgi:hypothetical protein
MIGDVDSREVSKGYDIDKLYAYNLATISQNNIALYFAAIKLQTIHDHFA